MYIWTQGLWIVEEVRTIPASEQDDLKWDEIFERQNEIKTELPNVDLKYQQSEPEFSEKPEAKVIKLLCVILPLSMYGRAGVGGIELGDILSFLERVIMK